MASVRHAKVAEILPLKVERRLSRHLEICFSSLIRSNWLQNPVAPFPLSVTHLHPLFSHPPASLLLRRCYFAHDKSQRGSGNKNVTDHVCTSYSRSVGRRSRSDRALPQTIERADGVQRGQLALPTRTRMMSLDVQLSRRRDKG